MTENETLWKGGTRQRRLIRWYSTQWCNYRCPYCPQKHERKQIFRGSPGHWFDNHPIDAWVAAFRKHFAAYDLALHFTGGEPMLDRRNVDELLTKLVAEPYLKAVKVDTNGTWNPESWSVPKDKLMFMMSYHPSEASDETFLSNIDRIRAAGWNVVVVNLVMLPGRFDVLPVMRDHLKPRGILINVIPVDGQIASFSQKEIAILREYTLPETWDVRTGASPYGQECLHPAVAYKVFPDGSLEVGCHEHLSGSLFDERLPDLFDSYVPCPRTQCLCIEKFTFLKDLGNFNEHPLPLHNYTNRLRSLPVLA